jgi:hypothetical protein
MNTANLMIRFNFASVTKNFFNLYHIPVLYMINSNKSYSSEYCQLTFCTVLGEHVKKIQIYSDKVHDKI